MSSTRAVPSQVLAEAAGSASTGRPLCPACKSGFLQPYKVWMPLTRHRGGGFEGASALTGWVAICQGNAEEIARRHELYVEAGQTPPVGDTETKACGFSLTMTPEPIADVGSTRQES